jgi:hypothetical protein
MLQRIFSTMLALAPLLSGQGVPRIAAGLSPVPLWPQDGDTSQLPAGQYVFYDPPSGEYVVYYAARSDSSTTTDPIVLRFGTHALLDPAVTATVTSGGNGSLHYAYEISNGTYARQSIQRISLLVASDSTLRASHPNWASNMGDSGARDITAPGANLSTVDWASNTPGQTIAPGTKLGGFLVDSTLLPGFTTMIWRGATRSREYSPEAVASLPAEARDQISRVFTGAWDVKSRLVVGPRFPKGAPQSDIAQNFLLGMQSLMRERQLDSTSPFVQSAVALLSAQLESGGPVVINPNGIAFDKAKPGLEGTIANALQIALAQ